jgi:hypothetical protein
MVETNEFRRYSEIVGSCRDWNPDLQHHHSKNADVSSIHTN